MRKVLQASTKVKKKAFLFGVMFTYALLLTANPINNFMTKDGYPRLIPAVQKFNPGEGKFVLPENLTVTAPAEAAYEVKLLGRELKKRFPKYSVSSAKAGVCRLVLTSESVPESPEGYSLTTGKQGIEIRSRDLRGLYYGVQTLCNMIRNLVSPELPVVAIEDWPDLKLRGVYMRLRMYNSQDAARFLKVIEAYGALKYNTLLLEFAENFPYKDNPFTLRKCALTKHDLREIVRVAKANKMKIMLFLQVLSHDSWLKSHPKYKTDICEGPSPTEWTSASCPSRPLPRKLNLMAIHEQIDFFKPEFFSINMDEILQCPWGVCKLCKSKDPKKMWEEQTLFYTGEILKRGVRPLLAHDSYYRGNNVGGEQVVPKLDPRVGIVNWDYDGKIRTERFDFFKKYNLTTFGMTYCSDLNNTGTMPLEVKKRGLPGVIFTLWHFLWKFTDYTLMAPRALAGVTTAGDFQWKCRDLPAAALDYDPAYETVRLFVPEKAPTALRPGTEMTPVPLEKVVNAELGKDDKFPLLDAEMIENLRKELANTTEKFRLITSGDKYYAAAVTSGDDNYPASEITVPIACKVKSLSFLLAAAGPNYSHFDQVYFYPTVGRITFVWSDGRKRTRDLRYRDSINYWNATASGLACRFVSRFNDKREALCGLFALDWRNPRPDVELKEIRYSSIPKAGVASALFAISASGGNAQAKFPATAKAVLPVVRVTKKPEVPVHRTLVTKFDSGTVPANVKLETVGKFSGETTLKVVSDETAPVPGKVLRMDIAPTADYAYRNRVLIDVMFDRSRVKGKINSIILDYKIGSPEYIFFSSTYLRNTRRGMDCIAFYDFTRYYQGDDKWHHVVLPLDKMRPEEGGTNGEEGNCIRVSFFLRWHDRPFSIWFGRIGVSDEISRLAPPLNIEKVPRLDIGTVKNKIKR
ncbi:MAG: beta-N-acetylhexosaminidase [Victivallales bacterium]|nr:beta-N-acetylhexosaminidase [Victivallales bacterium]